MEVELDLPDDCYEPAGPALEIGDIVAAVPFPQGGEVFEHDGSFLIQAVWAWGTVLLIVQGFAVVAPVFLPDQATDAPGFEALVRAGRTARMTIRLPRLRGVWEHDSICVLFMATTVPASFVCERQTASLSTVARGIFCRRVGRAFSGTADG